jgi:two-component system phosphate regulon sensor histidine kinase PhoR
MAQRRLKNPPQARDWSQFIVQNTPGGVITADAQGRIIEFNSAAERLTGYGRQEAMGRLATEILNCEGGETACAMNLVMTGQAEVTQELVLRNRSGQQVPVMVSSFALRDEQGKPHGGAIIIRDLTQVKHLEQERRQLVNMFAHDLRAPVVGVAGLVRRLREGKGGPLTEVQKDYLETIGGEMARLEKLITGFLEFARLGLRILTPRPEDIQPVKECRQVVALMLPLAEAKGMAINTRFPRQVPGLRADPLLFRQVLENLLENAIKYSPPHSEIELELRVGDSEVSFAVKDRGPGISKEDLPHLFEVFYRGRRTGAEPGYGLGLAAVKRIVDAHGGRLWVDTTPGRGTAFFFTFPLNPQEILPSSAGSR